MKGIGIVTLHFNQGQTIHLQVLYVPNLKKNLMSISAMEDKGFKVALIDGKIHIWHRNTKGAFTLGFRVDGLYRVEGSTLGALASDTSLQCELWHIPFSHLHYTYLPHVRKMFSRIPEIRMDHKGVFPRCVSGKNIKGQFHSSRKKSRHVL